MALPAFAAEKEPASSHKLSEFSVGELITGPEANLQDTQGKAVVIEAWGVNCGPCIASLPHIEKIAKRNKDKMIVIGAHSQNATDEQEKEVVKKNRLSYTITKGMRGPVSSGGIPHAYVFNTKGELIFHGHPMDKDFDKAVRKATQGASSSSGSQRPSGLDSLKRPGTSS